MFRNPPTFALTVGLADIYSVIAYYLRHQPEIQAYTQRQRQAARSS